MVEIRPYHKNDLPAILFLIKKNLVEINSKVYPPNIIEFMIQQYSDVVGNDLFKKFSLFLVIEGNNNEILGCAGWKPADMDPKIAYLSSMFISVNHHRSGLGNLLLNQITLDAKTKGCPKMICAASLNAIPFYEHFGFIKREFRDAGLYGKVMDMEYSLI